MPDCITQFIEKMPKATAPVVGTASPNEQVLLHEGTMSLTIHGGDTIRGRGTIFLHWMPKPSLWYWLEIGEKNLKLFQPYDAKGLAANLEFDSFPNTIESVHLTPICISTLLQSTLSRRFEHGFSHGNGIALSKTIFHVANCLPFLGTGAVTEVRSEEGYSVNAINGRCQFTVQGWDVTLDRLVNAKELAEQMEDTPGFGITHVGQLTRQDGAAFSGKDARGFLENLSYLLSFCSSRWCGVLLAFGYDSSTTSNNPAWINWDVGRVDLWKEQRNWFPMTDGLALSRLAPGFLNKMADPLWMKPLRTATNWYLEAMNPGTMDSGIVLTQVGLELLSWTHMVHATNTHSKRAFDRLSAQGRIATLLGAANIPPAIPPTYASLTQYAASVGKTTGPEVTANMRNALVHGSDIEKYLRVGGDVCFEAWDLGLRYFELLILWLSQYQGQYVNRASGVPAIVYEVVPWVP